MNSQKEQRSSFSNSTAAGLFALTVLSLGVLGATFLLAMSGFSFETKVGSFAVIVLFYVAISVALYFLNGSHKESGEPVSYPEDNAVDSEIENRLLALEEANRYFGTSLKPPDMFRLAASRVKELVPFSACMLLYTDDNTGELRTAFADGDNNASLRDVATDQNNGLAAKAALSRKPQIDETLLLERSTKPAAAIKGFRSSIAVPLFNGVEVFGVLQLFGDKFDENSLSILEAISERAAPLFIGSRSLERTLSNAMTDSLTNLPNERAFYMVLENQVAESQRYPDDRQLTILAIDVRNFTELNQQFGHATGDRVLSFAAETIRAQLRKMDFLARSMNDEFLAVLPTAPERVGLEIVERIERALTVTPFRVSDKEFTNLQFNFGTASFSKDGETAHQLLQNALLRKQQTKSVEPNKVLWFPREYVN